MTVTPAVAPAEIKIRPEEGWVSLNLAELWAYRELLYYFIWRDIKVRYRQTVLGASWAIIQPFFTMVVFSIFFGNLAKVPSDGLPYPIFSFAALVPWTFFATGLTQAANSLVQYPDMVKKIYFPRLTMPIASVSAGIIDFVLAFTVLLIMMPFFDVGIGIKVLYLPLFLLLAYITCLGASFWLSAMNVQFRDVRYVVPFMVQLWFFLTPITYSSNLLSEPWRTIYGINPLAGVVEGFRWALLDTPAPGPIIIVSTVVSLIMTLSGMFYFRRMEKTFADVV